MIHDGLFLKLFPKHVEGSDPSYSRPRLYMPRKPTLTEASISDKDYSELSTKFKACHIKLMVYWAAKKTEAVASANPEET